MRDLNKVQLTGHVGAEPTIHHTDTGTVVTKFTVASNRRWNDQDGEAQEETEWFNIVCFAKLAEIAGDYLNKGAHVYLEGRLHTHAYDDDSGQKRYWTEVIASELIMLDRRADSNAGGPLGGPPHPRRGRDGPRNGGCGAARAVAAGDRTLVHQGGV